MRPAHRHLLLFTVGAALFSLALGQRLHAGMERQDFVTADATYRYAGGLTDGRRLLAVEPVPAACSDDERRVRLRERLHGLRRKHRTVSAKWVRKSDAASPFALLVGYEGASPVIYLPCEGTFVWPLFTKQNGIELLPLDDDTVGIDDDG